MSADESMGLHVDITGDASSVVSASQQAGEALSGFEGVSAEAMAALTTALNNLDLDLVGFTEKAVVAKTATSELGNQVSQTAAKTAEAGGIFGEASKFIDDLSTHTMVASRAMGVLGLDTEAAAVRVAGLAELFEGLGASMGPMLAIGAGITAMFAAFEGFKTAVEETETLIQAMDALKASIDATGGSWAQAQSSIQKFLDTESMATGITTEQLAPALRDAMDATHDLADAQTILRVAEEISIATGMSVAEATRELIELEVSRGVSVEELDTKVKSLILNHAKMSEVLQVLHGHFGMAIQDQDRATLAWNDAKVKLEDLSETIVEKSLPALQALGIFAIDAVEAFGKFLNAVGVVGNGLNELVGGPIRAAIDGFDALWDVMHGKPGKAADEMKAALNNIGSFGKGILDTISGLVQMGWQSTIGGVVNLIAGYQRAARELDKAISDRAKAANNIHLNNDPNVGTQRGKKKGTPEPSPYSPTDVTDMTADTSATNSLAAATSSLAAEQNAAKAAGDALHFVLDQNATSASQDAKQAAAQYEAYQAAAKSVGVLQIAVQQDADAEKSAAQVQRDAKAVYDAQSQSLESLQNSLRGKTKLTTEDKQRLDDAKRSYDISKIAYEESDKALHDVTETMKEHTKALAEGKKAMDAFNESQQKMIVSYNDQMQKAQQTQADTIATYGKSIAQTEAYYTQRYQIAHAANEQFAAENGYYDKALLAQDAAAFTKMLDEQTTYYEKQVDAAKTAHDDTIKLVTDLASKATDLFSGFFTAGENGMQHFVDAWKKMLDDLLSALVKSGIMELLAGFFHVNIGSFGQVLSGNLGLPGVGGTSGGSSVLGGSASSSSVKGGPSLTTTNGLESLGMNTAQAALVSTIAGNTGGALGSVGVGLGSSVLGGGGGISGLLSGLLGGAAGPALTSGVGVGLGADVLSGGVGVGLGSSVLGGAGGSGATGLLTAGGGINWGMKFGGATLGSYMLAAAGGALVGQTLFGGKGYADVGGSIGGVAGLAFIAPLLTGLGSFGGPVGALLGALGGSFIGSLFGDHFSQANEPDIYDQQAWGQENADMTGATWNANGKPFQPDSWTNQMTGGKGWNIVMESFVSKFRGNVQQLPPELQAVFPQIEALWGGANGQSNFNTDGKDGYLDIGSGKRALWSEFWSYVSGYGADIAQIMNMYSPVSTYDASGGSASMLGTFTPSGSPYSLHDFPDYPGASIASGSGSGSGGGSWSNPGHPIGGGTGGRGGGGLNAQVVRMSAAPPVVINVAGSVIQEQDLAKRISQLLAALPSSTGLYFPGSK